MAVIKKKSIRTFLQEADKALARFVVWHMVVVERWSLDAIVSIMTRTAGYYHHWDIEFKDETVELIIEERDGGDFTVVDKKAMAHEHQQE
jgi:hypothetical protein